MGWQKFWWWMLIIQLPDNSCTRLTFNILPRFLFLLSFEESVETTHHRHQTVVAMTTPFVCFHGNSCKGKMLGYNKCSRLFETDYSTSSGTGHHFIHPVKLTHAVISPLAVCIYNDAQTTDIWLWFWSFRFNAVNVPKCHNNLNLQIIFVTF